jgi:hypothetical protein
VRPKHVDTLIETSKALVQVRSQVPVPRPSPFPNPPCVALHRIIDTAGVLLSRLTTHRKTLNTYRQPITRMRNVLNIADALPCDAPPPAMMALTVMAATRIQPHVHEQLRALRSVARR